MIQPPLEACRKRKWETSAVAFAVMIVMSIPIGVALFGLCARSAAEEWLQGYTPIVYLEPQTSTAAAASLAGEIGEWELVASATVREGVEAHDTLVERLGADVVKELGVTASMLPRSIVIEPSVPVAGHIDLVSRVSGLQARMEVDAVEVPSSGAMQVITGAGVGLLAAAGGGLLGVFAALVLLFGYLQRLRRADEELDRVLSLFGAHGWELRRPTLIRGLVVAAACGAVVGAGSALALLAWQVWSLQVVGAAASIPVTAWAIVTSVVLIMPVLGVVAGWFASLKRIRVWRGAHA